jgi:YD repeat-containing protein
MQAPVSTSFQVTTPGGLSATLTETREVMLADPYDLLSLNQATTTVTVNGRSYTSIFDAAAQEVTDATPMGRQRRTTLDTQGRVIEEQLAGLDPVQWTYDTEGRLTTLTQGPRTAVLTYDA